MHLHFEKNVHTKCDCSILSLSWMGKVPEELPEEEGWKLNRNNYYQEGWLATGNVRGIVGVTFTSSHAGRTNEVPLRTNYNLRGHRSDVVLVKWNEPYQKLASCDSSGVIFVWIKYEGRWSIELINDRSTPVTHFSWSHDGRMALICYRDDFVLVGSVAGQRYWSSMLSLDALITAGCWTPDDSQVYLGTASGQLVVMDVHGAMVSQVQLATECGITSMAWSCEKFKMEENDEVIETPVNHVLAVALGNGELVFMRGHDDVSPVRVKTGLGGENLVMEWANSKELLAVAGTTLIEGEEDNIYLEPIENMVKFYTDTGALIYSVQIPCTQAHVTALTWGHGGRRLFVSLKGWVWCARVWREVAPLQLLARVCAARALQAPAAANKLPLPPALRHPLAALFAHTVRCMVPSPGSVRVFVSRPPCGAARLHCTMLRHRDPDAAAHYTYTLYLEHMGGLVPLLKGKRTSKIRPEFVIFDPQAVGQGVVTSGTLRESSSSSSGGSRGSGSPRPPGSPRLYTDSSDTERDDGTVPRALPPSNSIGCSGSPRRRPRRRLNGRRKARLNEEKQETREELAYIDSLPEDVKLVEVTSNIWGTKFKMHGLAKNVPANLGQVTYKTSLLHLQPRQMTLMITELRDDQPVGPDPNFNPNIFSEDEEDVFQTNETNISTNNNRRKLTLNARNNTYIQQSDNSTNNNITNPSLARAESYDEFPFIDMTEPVNPVRCSQHERRVSANTSCGNRHAISPLRCEGSVPTLQSPKNAVAPTDIIFERPSPQTVSCGGRGDFCGGRTDYSVRDNTTIKANIEQQSFNLNLSLEPSRHVTIKKCETHITENCLTKLRKNICNRGEPASYEMNTRIIKSFCNKSYEHEIHPDAMKRDGLKTLQRNDELKFIDEETPVETTITNLTDRNREFKVQRTTTVVPISPVVGNVPFYNTMTRSCSVGYLDLVDPQVLHAQSSIAALNDQPRRLVLVNNKKKRQRKHYKDKPLDAKTPSLKKCGKSKSLDSSELSIGDSSNKSGKRQSRLDLKCDLNKADNLKVKEVSEIKSNPRKSVPIEEEEIVVVPSVKVEVKKAAEVVNLNPTPIDSDSDYSKYYRSLEQLAMRLLASRSGIGTRSSGLARECASAPASPRPARIPNVPAPSTPAPRPRQRHSSASPIRQLLNSPLLNRRRNKKPSESSDDETSNGYSEVNGRNYRDLETFQKAQLRNKIKRNNGNIPGMSLSEARSGNMSDRLQRRQLVMHNKAPMWNENSQVYQLDFGGRVTQESAKNFQIEYHGKQVMQFGRIDGNAYTLDFQYPFSAIQAFAVALANVTQRLK